MPLKLILSSDNMAPPSACSLELQRFLCEGETTSTRSLPQFRGADSLSPDESSPQDSFGRDNTDHLEGKKVQP